MMTSAAYYFHAALYRLCQKPVLTAMMVSSLVFGATALTAGIAVWRVNSLCSTEPKSALPNTGQVANRSDLWNQHQALQVELGTRIGQAPQYGPALSHNEASASCPCAAFTRWHGGRPTWQRI
ncbi:MAG: hypothetical protein M3N91_07150 [Pseudomonadota bacterium]|nr:hypothetical protein [Pseudomonadota bacterium]